MQHVRLAENELRKLDLRVAHAVKLQSTYKALVAQLDKDEAQATAELDAVEHTLQKSSTDIARLRQREKAAATQSADAAAQCSVAQDHLQAQQAAHDAERAEREDAINAAAALVPEQALPAVCSLCAGHLRC